MKIVFLGTGTSVGVPVIGCSCPVCMSGDARNKRLRTSLYVVTGSTRLLVDTSPDFRMQALANGIMRVDAVVFTHSHVDHILGFDDIRRFNTIQDCVIPAYGSPETIADMKRIFDYVGRDHIPGMFRPRVEFREFAGPFSIGGVNLEPLAVAHEHRKTHGFRIEADGCSFGYFPDCREMSDEVVARLGGMDVMILDALRHRPHGTHLSLSESVALLKRIKASRSFVTHMCHDLDHDETQKELPESMFVPHDGLTLEWQAPGS